MQRPRSAAMAPLHRALAQLAAGWAAGLAVVVALVRAGPNGDIALVYGFPLVAALYAAAGLLAWWRRPTNRLGALLVVAGAAFLCVSLANTGLPVLIAAGTVTATVPLAVVVHLLHAFPGGRLHGRAAVATVIAGYAVTFLLQVPIWAFRPAAPPYDLVVVSPRPDLASAGAHLQQACGVVVVAVTVWLLVLRLREYAAPQRRVLAPLLGYGLLAVLAIPIGGVLGPLLGVGVGVAAFQLIALAGVPLAFAAVLLRGGFARTGELDAFVTSLASSAGSPVELERAVATTLGDPSATLLQWSPDLDCYLDTAGRSVPLPGPGERRAATRMSVGDRPVAAVLYDARLIEEAAAVVAVTRVAAIALDRERLVEEVSENRRALRDASSRLVSSNDEERRRIARDLHDGLQVSLVRLSIQAHQLAQEPPGVPSAALAAQMAAEVDDAAAALRALVHGVMPSPLVERGLAAAVQELAFNLPVRTRLQVHGIPARLSAPVESTAYFVVAEALTNVVKHARARQATVRLRTEHGLLVIEVADDGVGGAERGGSGSGLTGLHDRLEVLGGTLAVTSGATGTRLRAQLPCD